MPPPRKGNGTNQAGGLSGAVLGAADPHSEPPSFSAMCAAIFCGLVSIVVILIACHTTQWFVSDTGSHAGLFVMVEKDWECGDTCPSKTRDQEGGWKDGGTIVYLGGILTSMMIFMTVILNCVNLTEYCTRKKALVACASVDVASLILIALLGVYWYFTSEERSNDTKPDKNGVTTSWTIGPSYLGMGLGAIMSICAAAAAMAAKPEATDEGKEAAIELSSPEVKYKMAPQGFAPSY